MNLLEHKMNDIVLMLLYVFEKKYVPKLETLIHKLQLELSSL